MKFNKTILFAIPTISTMLPMTALTSCNQSLINGLKGINTSISGSNLVLNMLFTKNIKGTQTNVLINGNNVIMSFHLDYRSTHNESGLVSVIAIDDTIFSFYWTCVSHWIEPGQGDPKLDNITSFAVHDIGYKPTI